MEILITGGNGVLGRHLVSALQDRGDTIRVLAMPFEDTSWLEHRGVAVHRGDICQPETLAKPMTGVHAVFHLAGMMGHWRQLAEYHAVNVIGTENVCRAALAERVHRVVHVSSWAVYGMGLGEVVREDHLLRRSGEAYATTKAAGDIVVQQMIVDDRLPAVITRPGAFFGPGDRMIFSRLADRLRAGRGLIVGPGDNRLPLVYVTDVVHGLLLALDHENAVGQAYNIANDRPLTQLELLTTIAAEIDAEVPHIHIPYRALYAGGYAAEKFARLTHSRQEPVATRLGVKMFGTDNRLSIDKARRELGYRAAVDLREGVRLAAHWYRNGMAENVPSTTAAA
jgi:nucleoside-diphosphate-sugar epimerase